MTRGARGLNIYVAAVITTAVIVASLAVAHIDESLLGTRPETFVIFAVLLLLGELRPVQWLRRREGGAFTASWTFACSLLLIAPAAGAMLAASLASFVADAASRQPLVKSAFNAANMCISLAVGAALLSFAGRGSLLSPDASLATYLPIAVVALVALFIVNGVLTSVVIALAQEVPVWPMVRRGVTLNLSTDGMLLALSPIFVVVAERSLMLIPLLLLTAWAVYRSAELALERHHAASHDSLTDLPNRSAFLEHLEEALGEAKRRSQSMAVVMLDLDGFKEVNDRLGHHVGDLVLVEVAKRLTATLRASDMVGRLGGDEFAVALPRTDLAAAEKIVERFHDVLSEPLRIENFPVRIGGSFGIALMPEHGDTVETLMLNADVAMYTAKQCHLGTQVYVPGRTSRTRGRMSLLGQMQKALDDREFVLHYQTKQDLITDTIAGVEALVRWQHPVFGLIPPDEFMPLAEHTELMGPFTDYVLRAALEQAVAWRTQGLEVPVAVNISARNIHDVRFPGTVVDLLRETNISGRLLDLEITENTVMADPARSASVLEELKRAGVSISIDDFGTGFSSLANLRDLPVDHIKIDRSFVTDMVKHPGNALLVRSIVQLAQNLGLGTVAEGVEDEETVHALRKFGITIAQGYHFGRPLPAAKITDLLIAGLSPALPRLEAV